MGKPGWCEYCGEDHAGACPRLPLDDEPDPSQCTGECKSAPPAEQWAYTGTAYGGDDERYHGEGRCYCIFCGADGDA